MKDSRLRAAAAAAASPVTLASAAERGTVTGAQLPSPNRLTNTCLGRVQTYRHMLFNIHRQRCACKTHYLPPLKERREEKEGG